MKILRFLSAFSILFCLVLNSNAQDNSDKKTSQDEQINKTEVYYFHLTRRCTTCKTVEAEARKAVEELYPEEVKNGLVSFTSINIEEEGNEEIIEKLGVNGQCLLIVKNGKQEDITNEGFLYATSKPDKLKAKIAETIKNI